MWPQKDWFQVKGGGSFPLEVWIICKEETFQPIRFVANFPWHALAFNLEELPKSAESAWPR
jgi:hypothetical protein